MAMYRTSVPKKGIRCINIVVEVVDEENKKDLLIFSSRLMK
jgi:hypothetical protein